MCIPILAELQQVKSSSNNQQTANGMGLLILGVFQVVRFSQGCLAFTWTNQR